MMQLGQAKAYIHQSIQALYPGEEARFMALDLLGGLFSCSRSAILMRDPSEELSSDIEVAIQESVERLLSGEPIQYILGEAPFGDLTLEVGAGVLIPRPETEELGAMIVREWQSKEHLSFLDLGTGSGCIALYLASHLHLTQGFALEKSPEAAAIAQRNFARYTDINGLNNPMLLLGDMTQPKEWIASLSSLDIIVSNPPYVQPSEAKDMALHVLGREPAMALFAPEDDSLFFYRTIAELTAMLPTNKGARLYLEINALLGEETRDLLASYRHLRAVELLHDMSGRHRFVVATINS